MVLKLVQLESDASVEGFLRQHSLLFFYGPSCPPCNRLKPKLFEALGLLPHLVTIGFVDGQKHKALRLQYGAAKIPYLLIFKSDSANGSETQVGLQDSNMDEVARFLNEHLDLGLKTQSFDPTVDF